MKRKKSSGKKRINKKRLLLVLIVLVFLIFGISKLFIGVKNMVQSGKQEQQPVERNADEAADKEKIITVFIDPAKGGINQGLATPDGSLREKDVALDIGKRVKANLEKHKDVKVYMTREYDTAKSIEDRVFMANDNKADVFVSIRLNAQANSGEAEGMDTYYSDLASKKKLVRKDDSSKDKNDSEIVSSISNKKNRESDIESPLDSKKEKSDGRENLSESLANSIQSTTLSFVTMKDRGIVKKNFDVLNYTKMPSVIVQCGFISNKSDGEKLQSDKYRQDIADGIGDGILNFIDAHREDVLSDRVNYR